LRRECTYFHRRRDTPSSPKLMMLTNLEHHHDHINFPTTACNGRYRVRCCDKLCDRSRNAQSLAIEGMVRPHYKPRTSMFTYEVGKWLANTEQFNKKEHSAICIMTAVCLTCSEPNHDLF
jgi:hypothetical protein